jgi:hypothetical protein
MANQQIDFEARLNALRSAKVDLTSPAKIDSFNRAVFALYSEIYNYPQQLATLLSILEISRVAEDDKARRFSSALDERIGQPFNIDTLWKILQNLESGLATQVLAVLTEAGQVSDEIPSREAMELLAIQEMSYRLQIGLGPRLVSLLEVFGLGEHIQDMQAVFDDRATVVDQIFRPMVGSMITKITQLLENPTPKMVENPHFMRNLTTDLAALNSLTPTELHKPDINTLEMFMTALGYLALSIEAQVSQGDAQLFPVLTQGYQLATVIELETSEEGTARKSFGGVQTQVDGNAKRVLQRLASHMPKI